ncbi:MAG: phosphatidylserine/phosphatidylglycerophosphate/cardiolipin synthase family protein [Nanoarchaeota archaeon]|nr:phosphatidylserine/phosphatidylglycerophosphate/cardiolipin synthase family protein [Nanoarchaeota archaeon]
MKYKILSDPKKIYRSMLSDIRKARKKIILETYIYDGGKIGKEFRDELEKKALEGVKVKLLIDGWGSSVKKSFFKKLIEAGGEVKFFREIRYVLHFFNANQERNHRKLLIIDSKISYLGSINITSTCLSWEELVLRIEGTIAKSFETSFRRTWKKFDSWDTHKVRRIIHKGIEIIQDLPSSANRSTERNYKKLIRNAEEEILIETPYFIPPMGIKKAIKKALKRGVKIKLIIPKISDVGILDVFRNRYLGRLSKKGVEIFYFPKILHSKLLIVDRDFFLLGSSNLDYRSFRHQYEINILVKNKDIVDSLRIYFYKNIKKSKAFNYNDWHNRNFLGKIVEIIMKPFRKYL